MASPNTISELRALLERAANDTELFQAIVDAPFQDRVTAASMFLGVVVLLLVNPKTRTIDRITLSNTEIAERTKQMSMKRFEDIHIPLGHPENIISQAIETGKPREATDWKYLFVPEMTAEHARYNQADGGIAFSSVHPLTARDGGALIFSYYQQPELMDGGHSTFMKDYTQLVDEVLGRS